MRVGEVRHPERGEWGKPLAGVRVLAAEQMQALPYATQLLAHLGAEVVKVEHPRQGESGRGARPAVVDEDGREVGATYLRNNLGKRSIGIDLKRPEGVELFKRLAPRFDVVAENFRPGTFERLGLGWEVLSYIAPKLILVSVSGFGNLDPSPYASWPAYAPIPEAMAGLYEQNRRGDQRPVPLVAGALGDIGSGMFAVIGTLAALQHRARTGLGQHVDVAMFDAMVAMMDMVPFMPSLGAKLPSAGGGGYGVIDCFRASDGWFVLEVIREHQFARLAETIGRPEWKDDPRFATRADWDAVAESEIRPAIEAWSRDKTRLEACAALCGNGVAAGPSNAGADLRADPHVAMRDMLIEVPRPDGGPDLLVVGNPVKMSRLSEGAVTRWPRLGEHTDDVLREAGIRTDEIDSLRESGVI